MGDLSAIYGFVNFASMCVYGSGVCVGRLGANFSHDVICPCTTYRCPRFSGEQ